ncbi:hypothetical protein [Aquimarina longa]|uniref:hypothetical protein n=1 Tax=Aquimarina longa TaxID=1080221 RepID=UPI0007846494|nr:hypothetical protein [Aquimarina longa]
MNDIEKEVVDVLTKDPDTIDFEELQSEHDSPLNQAVIEKDIHENSSKNWNAWKPEQKEEYHQNSKEPVIDSTPLDAPEQDIGNDTVTDDKQHSESEFELPTATAKQAADTILGMTNNVLSVGGGFLMKIKKHKDFYDFDEIVELIDQQNEKNLQRIILDKDDKAMLKPLIVAILKKKAKKLTPEQQLTGAILSILMKKAQVVLEVRGENEILFDRILDIVQKEKDYPDPDTDVDQENIEDDISDTTYEEVHENSEPDLQKIIESEESEAVIETVYDDEEPSVN